MMSRNGHLKFERFKRKKNRKNRVCQLTLKTYPASQVYLGNLSVLSCFV